MEVLRGGSGETPGGLWRCQHAAGASDGPKFVAPAFIGSEDGAVSKNRNSEAWPSVRTWCKTGFGMRSSPLNWPKARVAILACVAAGSVLAADGHSAVTPFLALHLVNPPAAARLCLKSP